MIFYFSATGNSKQIASELAALLNDNDFYSITDYDIATPIKATSIGFVFPTYFWGVPTCIENFIRSLNIVGNPYIYAIATCGGTHGVALHQVNHFLKDKELNLSAGFYIVMPENYIVSYNVTSEDQQKKQFVNAKEQVKCIAEYVNAKKPNHLKRGRYVIDGLIGKPVNKLYRKSFPTKDKGFVVNDRCIGCGLCQKSCQFNNVTLVNDRPIWKHHCEFCLACIHHCPTHAIDWKNKTQKRARYLNPNIKC